MALAQSAQAMQRGARGGAPAGAGGMASLLNMANAMSGRQRTASISPQPMRETLHLTGWAEKQGSLVKNWKKRYFTLSNTALKVCACMYVSDGAQRVRLCMGLLALKMCTRACVC